MPRIRVVQAGTALSSRVRSGVPNSVNLLRWPAEGGRCQVEQWDFAAAAGAFVCVCTTDIQPARDSHVDGI